MRTKKNEKGKKIKKNVKKNMRTEKIKWFVYILKRADESFYTGTTTDLKRRVEERDSLKFGAKYARTR